MRSIRLLTIALVALLSLPALAVAKPPKDVDVQLLGIGGAVDTDALEDYLAPSLTGAPIPPPALDRIDVTP